MKDESGRVKYLKNFPQVATAESAARTLNRYMAEFGLTPSARTRIRVEHGGGGAVPSDPRKARFFSGG